MTDSSRTSLTLSVLKDGFLHKSKAMPILSLFLKFIKTLEPLLIWESCWYIKVWSIANGKETL